MMDSLGLQRVEEAHKSDLLHRHRRFLTGFKRGEPDWALLGIPEAKHLPAVMWSSATSPSCPMPNGTSWSTDWSAFSFPGFGPKVREWNATEMVERWRERWAVLANERLAEIDIDARIDHRSLEAQGMALEPQTKIGAPAHPPNVNASADAVRFSTLAFDGDSPRST